MRRLMMIQKLAFRRLGAAVLSTGLAVLAFSGCGFLKKSEKDAGQQADVKSAKGKTAGLRIVTPEQKTLVVKVVQPGTLEPYETTSVYSRISGYVNKYYFNIGDHVKEGDVLLDMWTPDLVQELVQKSATTKRAEVQIKVSQSALESAEAKVITAGARVLSAEAGVKRAQASYTRWESEYKRLQSLVNQQVLDVQVRDETYRQFEEADAARDQATAMVSENRSALVQAKADRDRARVDVDAARADLEVAKADEKNAKVLLDYGRIKAPYEGVVSVRNVSPGDYLQPGGGSQSRPLFVLEQSNPLRVFVGVPERASYFVHPNDTALLQFQAIPGITREGKVVRSGFSLNPVTRTLQTEIDIPNPDDRLRAGWYVTVTITIRRENAWTLPSNAVVFLGQQNYAVFLDVGGKTVRTPVIIGLSDDTHTEVLRKYVPDNTNTYEWPTFDGSERVLIGATEILEESQASGKAAK